MIPCGCIRLVCSMILCSGVLLVKSYVLCVFFFFKQKTAYEMCGRDWSSDVCSSDLLREKGGEEGGSKRELREKGGEEGGREGREKEGK